MINCPQIIDDDDPILDIYQVDNIGDYLNKQILHKICSRMKQFEDRINNDKIVLVHTNEVVLV